MNRLGGSLNDGYTRVVSHALGVDVGEGGASALREALHAAEQRHDTEIVAWCWTQLGDIAFFQDGLEQARTCYERGRRAHTSAIGPWIGKAQVAVGAKSPSDWNEAMSWLGDGLASEADPELVLRAHGLLQAHDSRQDKPVLEHAWRATAEELLAGERPGAAWHIWMAGAVALARTGVDAGLEEACARALGIATDHGIRRGAIWASLELCQHLRGWDRAAEGDMLFSGAMELAEEIGEPELLNLVLRLGCDLAAEVGHLPMLLERLRLRAAVCADLQQPAEQVTLHHQAFIAALRGSHGDAASLGGEFVEVLLGAGFEVASGLDISDLLENLVSIDSLDSARRLALAASQFAFADGRRGEASLRLVEAARVAHLLRESEQAREMFEEAIRVSETFGLALHQAWRAEMRSLLG